MELISTNLHYDFLGKRSSALVVSLCMTALAVFMWISKGESKYGVDYRGGTEVIVQLDQVSGSEELRQALEKAGFQEPVVQSFEIGSKQYSIRVGDVGDTVQPKIHAALSTIGTGKYEVLRTDAVGPTVGKELRRKAIIATILSLVAILIFIAIRFEFAFALGAVVALIHDVIAALGWYLLCGGELNGSTLAAALTIVGYSVNDTIVIFDRMREELLKGKKIPLEQLMNDCINTMLGRTIITSGLTLFSALTLLIFGGGAISDLSLYLVFGIIAGTYSTIFIASPVVLLWEQFQSRKTAAKKRAVAT